MATTRRYISYKCVCGYKHKFPLYADPKLGSCPKCNKKYCFYKKEIEEKIKRGKVKKKK